MPKKLKIVFSFLKAKIVVNPQHLFVKTAIEAMPFGNLLMLFFVFINNALKKTVKYKVKIIVCEKKHKQT